MTRLRGLAALVALGLAGIGVPWVLARFGNWPITGLPNAEQVGDLGDTLVSDTTVFAVLTVAAWAVWLVFVVSVAIEIAATARRVPAPRLALAGPLQRSARLLVAAVILAVTIQHPPRTASASPPSSTIATAYPADGLAATVTRTTAPSAPEPRPVGESVPSGTVVVERGDSAWSLAETHLGDGMRWRELWNVNRGVPQPDGRSWTDPQIIRPGWRLRLPTADALGRDETYVVVAGDTLSGIAESHLGDADRYPEIYDLNVNDEQPDGQELTDPNLIQPGWNLRLPSPDATPDVSDDRPPTTVPAADAVDTTTTTSVPDQEDETDKSPLSTPPPTASTAEPSSARPDTSDEDEGSRPLDPGLAGVAGAVVLATGLAVRVGWLRRSRATRGARHTVPPPAVAEVLDAVTSAADVPLIRWAGQQLARLTSRLDPRRVSGAPVAVEVSDVAGIEILWDIPQPAAPDPWTGADGGWAWRLRYDPETSVPADELPAALPALVTIGNRDGRQLLVDLEAYGAVAVSGDADRVDEFLRSIAVELATGDDLADADVRTVGLDVGLDVDRLATIDSHHDAIEHLDRVRQSVAATLDSSHPAGTFTARLGAAAPLGATVVVARPPDAAGVAALIEAAPSRKGVAVVVAAVRGPVDAPATVELFDDGTARLEPLGITFAPAALPATTTEELKNLLAELAEPAATDDDPHQQPPLLRQSAVDDVGSVNGHHDTDPPDAQVPARSDEADGADVDVEVDDPSLVLLVRVLGPPAVPDRPKLGRRELIITVLLACRAGPVAASALQDALWGGKPVEAKTVWNLIGATRRALGDLPDGTPVMPAADRARGTLRVDPTVVTDLALLRRYVERAHTSASSDAMRLLGEGLALVAGQPFDGAGYDWAHRDQDVAEASTLIERATEMLVDLALESDAVDVARDAVVRGLRGLPGNELLYRCRMRIDHHAGNLAGISAAYDELVVYLADLDTEPSPLTTSLFHELTQPVRH